MTDKIKQIMQATSLICKGEVGAGVASLMATNSRGTSPFLVDAGPLAALRPAALAPSLAEVLAAAAGVKVASGLTVGVPGATASGSWGSLAGLLSSSGGCDLAALGGIAGWAGLTGGASGSLSGLATSASASAGLGGLLGLTASATNGLGAGSGIPGLPGLGERIGGTDSVHLRALQEYAQQQYMAAYMQQQDELQQIHVRQQEAAQLALIMEAAEAQAEHARQSLADDQEEHHWHRRLGKPSVCQHWQRGHCQRSEGCGFAHPTDQKGKQGTRGPIDLMTHNYKTVVCRYFSQGSCSKGDACIFAHGADQLRRAGESLTEGQREKVENWNDVVAAQQAKPKTTLASAMASQAQLSAAQDAVQQEELLMLLQLQQVQQGLGSSELSRLLGAVCGGGGMGEDPFAATAASAQLLAGFGASASSMPGLGTLGPRVIPPNPAALIAQATQGLHGLQRPVGPRIVMPFGPTGVAAPVMQSTVPPRQIPPLKRPFDEVWNAPLSELPDFPGLLSKAPRFS